MNGYPLKALSNNIYHKFKYVNASNSKLLKNSDGTPTKKTVKTKKHPLLKNNNGFKV